jgi:hypothetical protein
MQYLGRHLLQCTQSYIGLPIISSEESLLCAILGGDSDTIPEVLVPCLALLPNSFVLIS